MNHTSMRQIVKELRVQAEECQDIADEVWTEEGQTSYNHRAGQLDMMAQDALYIKFTVATFHPNMIHLPIIVEGDPEQAAAWLLSGEQYDLTMYATNLRYEVHPNLPYLGWIKGTLHGVGSDTVVVTLNSTIPHWA